MGLTVMFIYLANCVFKRFALINTRKYPIDLRIILQHLRKNKILNFFKVKENLPLFRHFCLIGNQNYTVNITVTLYKKKAEI